MFSKRTSQDHHVGTVDDGIWRPLLAAIVVFLLFGGGIAVWAWQAPVAGAVIAAGEIKVEGETKTVQHFEGGIVKEILVRDGQAVATGDVLLRLDATDSIAKYAALEAERYSLVARASRLRTEISGEETIDFSGMGEDRLEMARSGARETAIASQQAVFQARTRERAAEQDRLEGSLVRLASRVAAVKAEIEGTEAQRALVRKDVEVFEKLAQRGNAPLSVVRTNQRRLASMTGASASLRAQLGEAEAAQAEAKIKYAESETKRVSQMSNELSEVVMRLAEIEPQLLAEQQRIKRTSLRAPVDGTIVDLRVATIGSVVTPGTTTMTIVPASAKLVAQVRLDTKDRERVIEKMSARVRIAGLQRRQDPAIEGLVKRISADRLMVSSGEAGDAGDKYYGMTISLGDVPPDFELSPGMPATAVVATRSRTVLDYVLSPIRDAIDRSMRED